MQKKEKELQEIRSLFCFKISMELKWFKLAVVSKKPDEIYKMAYQIDTMINIYELLVEMSNEMDLETLQSLVPVSQLMAFMYEQWLKKEDSRMEEMQDFLATETARMGLKRSA